MCRYWGCNGALDVEVMVAGESFWVCSKHASALGAAYREGRRINLKPLYVPADEDDPLG